MAKILEANENRYPLAGSMIHHQDGWGDLIAIGPDEIARLPKRIQAGIAYLLKTSHYPIGLVGFLEASQGNVHFTDGGSCTVARITQNGKVAKLVNWL